MSNKVSIRICVGTTCYVKGNCEIKKALENLPPEIMKMVDIRGDIDIDGCESEKKSGHPFVVINDRLIENATVKKVMDTIIEEINVTA